MSSTILPSGGRAGMPAAGMMYNMMGGSGTNNNNVLDEFFDDTLANLFNPQQMNPAAAQHQMMLMMMNTAGPPAMHQRSSGGQQRSQAQLGGIHVDLVELADRFEMHASLPGVRKEQVQLDVNGDVITVSVEFTNDLSTSGEPVGDQVVCETADGPFVVPLPPHHPLAYEHRFQHESHLQPHTWHRMERSHEFASRTIRMPETADLAQMGAKLDHGVLSLTIPKKGEFVTKQPRRIAVE